MFLWYYLGTIPAPYLHHPNTVPVLGVQDTRKHPGIRGFLTKRFGLNYKLMRVCLAGLFTFSIVPRFSPRRVLAADKRRRCTDKPPDRH